MPPAAASESFWQMGGFAAYVWPSYALAALVMAGLVVVSMRKLRKAQHTWNMMKAGDEA